MKISLGKYSCWGLLLSGWIVGQSPAVATSPDTTATEQLIARGEQVAIASDCQACHTAPGSKNAFSGGYGIASPMGVIYATNITPSPQGIGHYSEAEFAAAIRKGIRADGAHLYPAMPYTSFHLMTDEDIQALYAYFMHKVTPVNQVNTETRLPFPFNLRFSMAFWNAAFSRTETFALDKSKSAEWNRGNYLVNGLAHCDTCHTPRNFMMAEKNQFALSGAPLGSWYAPNITSDPVSGIGGWSEQELVNYLKTGRAVGKSQAAGGMAEAIEHSLQFLPDSDLHAIAIYLKHTAPLRTEGETAPAFSYGRPVNVEEQIRGQAANNAYDALDSGAKLFSGHCASCHQPDGSGSQNQDYPSLFHNTVTGMIHPENLISAILFGVRRTTADHDVLMPAFSSPSYIDQLTDQQVAEISNFVLHNYGNPQVSVTAGDVAWVRKGGHLPFLAALQPYIVPLCALGLIVLVLIVIGCSLVRSRRKHKSQ